MTNLANRFIEAIKGNPRQAVIWGMALVLVVISNVFGGSKTLPANYQVQNQTENQSIKPEDTNEMDMVINDAMIMLTGNLWSNLQDGYLIVGTDRIGIYINNQLAESIPVEATDAEYEYYEGAEMNIERYTIHFKNSETGKSIEVVLIREATTDNRYPWVLTIDDSGIYVQLTAPADKEPDYTAEPTVELPPRRR